MEINEFVLTNFISKSLSIFHCHFTTVSQVSPYNLSFSCNYGPIFSRTNTPLKVKNLSHGIKYQLPTTRLSLSPILKLWNCTHLLFYVRHQLLFVYGWPKLPYCSSFWRLKLFPLIFLDITSFTINILTDFSFAQYYKVTTKLKLMKSEALPAATYGCEYWTTKKIEKERIDGHRRKPMNEY